jgi:hypothetical protein
MDELTSVDILQVKSYQHFLASKSDANKIAHCLLNHVSPQKESLGHERFLHGVSRTKFSQVGPRKLLIS